MIDLFWLSGILILAMVAISLDLVLDDGTGEIVWDDGTGEQVLDG